MPNRPLAVALILLAAALAGPTSLPSAEAGPSSRSAALAHALETKRIQNANFQQVPLKDLVKWMRLATGYNFVIKYRALAKAGIDPADVVFTAELENVSVAQLLHLALESYELAYVAKGNVVYITTHADSLGKPLTRLYPISHITYTKTDFIAPDINLRPSDFTPVEEYEPERVVENDPLNTGEAVAELVQEIVAPEEWDNEGWSIRATDRYLVVRAPRAVHLQVGRALRIIASLK
jgi:type II secretory pathway component GspD/PulD (secretin)